MHWIKVYSLFVGTGDPTCPLLQMFAGEVERITDLSTEDRLYEFGKIYGSFLPDVIIGALTAGGSAAGSISKKLVDGLAKSSKLVDKAIDFSKFVGKKLKVGKDKKVDVKLKQVGDGVGISGKDMKRVLGEMEVDEWDEFIDQVKDPTKKKALEDTLDFCKVNKYVQYQPNAPPFFRSVYAADIAPEDIPMSNRLPKGIKPGDTFYFDPSKFNGSKKEEIKVLAKLFPNGVKFDAKGYPDFSPYLYNDPDGRKVKNEIILRDMKGNRDSDFRKADKEAGIDESYRKAKELTWHHHQDTKRMQLVPRAINNIPHKGGVHVLSELPRINFCKGIK